MRLLPRDWWLKVFISEKILIWGTSTGGILQDGEDDPVTIHVLQGQKLLLKDHVEPKKK